MQFINIAGAATLTGIGLGSLAGGALLWRRAGFDLAVFGRVFSFLAAIATLGLLLRGRLAQLAAIGAIVFLCAIAHTHAVT